jgi:hypothetical protein
MAKRHGMTKRHFDLCVVCGHNVPAEAQMAALRMGMDSADVCSTVCVLKTAAMTPAEVVTLVENAYEDTPARKEYLRPFYELLEQLAQDKEPWMQNEVQVHNDSPTDYVRPMGVEPPPTIETQPVFKPMKPSASIFIGGETDADVAQHVLMVCWGTAAK